MGALEKHDVIALYQKALDCGYKPADIGFIADSMGAASVLAALAYDVQAPGRNIRDAAAFVLLAPYNRFRSVLRKVGTPVAPYVAWLAAKETEVLFGNNPLRQQGLATPIAGFSGEKVDIFYNPSDNVIPAKQIEEIHALLPGARLHAVPFSVKRPEANDLHHELCMQAGEPSLAGRMVRSVRQLFANARQTPGVVR